MQIHELTPVGFWQPDSYTPAFFPQEMIPIIHNIREPVHIVREGPGKALGLACKGQVFSTSQPPAKGYQLMASLPALYPEWLGDRSFLEVHKLRFPYVSGAMFRGIASSRMVIAMGKAGMIGFFGAAGLPVPAVEKAVDEIQKALDPMGLSYGSNLIHSPHEPDMEEAIVDLYLRRGVRRVSAAAFMSLSPSIVKYSAKGLHTDPQGNILRVNHVFAKLSRPEVAKHFLEPAPGKILNQLVAQGKLTQQEAQLAAHVPIAEDITVEADSGGHTDNRPLPALFPTILLLRDEMVKKYGYKRPIRVGAAGGLGSPPAVAAAFAMGAAYVLTGSINQSTLESGLSMEGRKMLANACVADCTMAPAADMFELGVKVQVLKKGTLFSNRASQFYRIYSSYDSIESIPPDIRDRLEKEAFKAPMQQILKDTYDYFKTRNPKEIEKAENDPKYKMALVFRWYLGNSARWAMEGTADRNYDYQICSGPAIGAFNNWVRGSFLEPTENRKVVDIALNLLEGAAVVTRAQQLRTYGLPVPGVAFDFRPRPLS